MTHYSYYQSFKTCFTVVGGDNALSYADYWLDLGLKQKVLSTVNMGNSSMSLDRDFKLMKVGI